MSCYSVNKVVMLQLFLWPETHLQFGRRKIKTRNVGHICIIVAVADGVGVVGVVVVLASFC